MFQYTGPLTQILVNEKVIIGLPSSNEIQGRKDEEPTSEKAEEITKESVAVEIAVQQNQEGYIR